MDNPFLRLKLIFGSLRILKDPVASYGHNETNDHGEVQREVFINGIPLTFQAWGGINILLLALLITFILQTGERAVLRSLRNCSRCKSY